MVNRYFQYAKASGMRYYLLNKLELMQILSSKTKEEFISKIKNIYHIEDLNLIKLDQILNKDFENFMKKIKKYAKEIKTTNRFKMIKNAPNIEKMYYIIKLKKEEQLKLRMKYLELIK